MTMLGLTAKQQAFCEHYVSNGNSAYRAMLDAGYSKSYSVNDTAKNSPAVKQRLEMVHRNSQALIQASFDWRVNKLKQLIESIIGENGIVLHAAAGYAIAAVAEMNKMAGDYAPEKHLRMTVKATADKLSNARKAYEEA